MYIGDNELLWWNEDDKIGGLIIGSDIDY